MHFQHFKTDGILGPQRTISFKSLKVHSVIVKVPERFVKVHTFFNGTHTLCNRSHTFL